MACNLCKGKGKVFLEALNEWVSCPECGTESLKVEAKKNISSDTFDMLDWLNIPEEYRNGYYQRNVRAEKAALTKYTPESVSQVLGMFDATYENIHAKRLYTQRVMFYTGRMYDERNFIYACQEEAIRQNLTTAPLISLNTLEAVFSNVKTSYGESVRDKLGVSYMDYVNADIVFLLATAANTSSAISTYAGLIEERAVGHKPTYLFSYWNSQDLQKTSFRYILKSFGSLAQYQVDCYEYALKGKEKKGNLNQSVGNQSVEPDMEFSEDDF